MKHMIADRATQIDSSGIRKVFALAAKLKDPVDFSIGQPHFDTPDELKNAAIAAIEAGYNKYSQTAGLDDLREKIAGKLNAEFGWKKPAVMITSGVSGGLFLAFLSLINPGDEVVMLDPYFVIYKHVVNMLGGKCVFIDSYPHFQLPVEKIATAVNAKTKLIILNSPCNPTGAVYSENELRGVAEVAGKYDVPVISDEIYRAFSYDGNCASIASFYDRALVLRGFGKTYAMTAWRLGYAAGTGPMVEVIEQMTKIQQYTFVCAPTPFQKAAMVALDFDASDFCDQYRKKRDMVYEGLKTKFEVVKPAGAFYIFARAPRAKATEFVTRAIEHNVLVIPGNVFSERDSHFRISYAVKDEKIRQGIEQLCQLA